MPGLLIAVAALVEDHGPQSSRAQQFWAPEHRLHSRSSQAELPRGLWDLLRPGVEPMSPALIDGFFTIEPPGKPRSMHFQRTKTEGERCCLDGDQAFSGLSL